MDIKKLSKEELTNLLKDLKNLSKLKKDLGKRWVKLFNLKKENKNSYEVEYFSSIWEDEAFAKSLEVYSKIFSETPSKEDVVMVKADFIKWGIRVYRNDKRVDMSFSKVEKELK